MQDYNFWADLLDTFQSSPDWIKALWLLIPPGFLLALIRMWMRYRIVGKKTAALVDGELIYSIHRRADGEMQIVYHSERTAKKPTLGASEQPDREFLKLLDPDL